MERQLITEALAANVAFSTVSGVVVIAGDLAWVVAAVVLIGFTDVLTTEGAWLLGIISAAVAAFAAAQTVGLRRLGVRC